MSYGQNYLTCKQCHLLNAVEITNQYPLKSAMNHEESAPLQLASAQMSKSERKRWIYLIATLPILVVLAYGGYFLYLTFISLPGQTDEDRAFRELGAYLLQMKLGKESNLQVVGYAVQSEQSCSFLKLEAITTHCRGVGLVVPNFNEDKKVEVIEITNFLASALSKPCANLDALNVEKRELIRDALGCEKRDFRFRVVVQAISSISIRRPAGDSYFENRLIYEQSISGEI